MAEWDYLTIREVADHLQLHNQTVRNWVNAGELEYVQRGRTKYIPRAAAVALAGGTGLEMPELLTVQQVAELLKLNEQTLWNWINAGTFPAVRLGDRRFRVKRSDLDAFVDSNPYAAADRFWGQDSEARAS